MTLSDLQWKVKELYEEVIEMGGRPDDDAESIARRAEDGGNSETARLIRLIAAS